MKTVVHIYTKCIVFWAVTPYSCALRYQRFRKSASIFMVEEARIFSRED
jgi:uncharacterized membrane protein YwzB